MSGGNLPLAITIIATGSVLSGLATPALLGLAVARLVETDMTDVLIGLTTTVLVPILLGVASQLKWKDWTSGRSAELGLFGKFTIAVILYGSSRMLAPKVVLLRVVLADVILTVVLQITAAYLPACFIANRLLKAKRADGIAMGHRCALCNSTIGFVIARTYFPVTVALPVLVSSFVFNNWGPAWRSAWRSSSTASLPDEPTVQKPEHSPASFHNELHEFRFESLGCVQTRAGLACSALWGHGWMGDSEDQENHRRLEAGLPTVA